MISASGHSDLGKYFSVSRLHPCDTPLERQTRLLCYADSRFTHLVVSGLNLGQRRRGRLQERVQVNNVLLDRLGHARQSFKRLRLSCSGFRYALLLSVLL